MKKKKQTHYQIVLTQNNIIKKNIMIRHPKVKLQERLNEFYIYIYMRWGQVTPFLYG